MSDPNLTDIQEDILDLYENAPCGYVTTRMDGTIVKTNQTFLNWIGLKSEDLIQKKKIQDLFSVGGQIFYETHFIPLLQMQGFVNEVQFDLTTQNGASLPTLANSVVRKNAHGEPAFYRTTFFNITDRKKYEKELLAARKKAEVAARAKADFISMLSHEIRTPMNAIIGIANLLNSMDLSPQQKEYVRTLTFSSEHLLSLINDILDFSKIEAGKVVLTEKDFDIRKFIYSIVYGLKLKAEEKGLALEVDVDPNVPTYFKADALKIGQVITNLVGNAVKFTETGKVTVQLKLKELYPKSALLQFSVIDTGIGIAPDKVNSIFEEFTQADQEVSLKYGGTGLGLAISQKLLALYGSEMKVESVLNKGSVFSFELLLKIGKPTEEEIYLGDIKDSLPKKHAFAGLRALIAEDNEANIFVLTRFLQNWGVQYEIAHNGQEALEKIQKNEFHLVLMDIRMPVMTGFEATLAIRNLPEEKYKNIPIIALSASTKIGLENHLNGVDFTDFVGKPFQPEELFQKIALHCLKDIPLRQSKIMSPEESSALVDRRSFTIENYRSATDNDIEGLIHVLSLVIESYRIAKFEFETAFKHLDVEKLTFQSHRIRVSTQMLQAQALEVLLQRAKAILAGPQPESSQLLALHDQIQSELTYLIQSLHQEIESLRST